MFVKPHLLNLILLSLVLTVAAPASLHAQYSSQEAGPFPTTPPTTASPIWAKLILNGNVVTCYSAQGTATPTTWTQLGSPQTINFTNNPILVGIYITAHNASAISQGTIDNFSITPSPTYRLADSDIGAPSLMGTANLAKGVWTLTGSGADIWNNTDQFNFQPWLVSGNATIICRITSITYSGDGWQKIGIMIRDGLNSGSDYAMFCATPGNGVDFQYRLGANTNPDKTIVVVPPAPGSQEGITLGYVQTGTSSYKLRP